MVKGEGHIDMETGQLGPLLRQLGSLFKDNSDQYLV